MSEPALLNEWLIASDIDGTLNTKRRRLPERNREAIRRFVYDCGGTFMLASGRSVESMRPHFEKLHLNHGYAVFINGAGIYDYEKEEILWISMIDDETTRIIQKAAHKFPLAKLQIVCMDKVHMVRPTFAAWVLAVTSKLHRIRYANVDDVPTGDWCKAIFTGLPETMDKLQSFVTAENGGDRENLMRSSPCSFEVVNKGTNKGVAVMKAAKMLGIDPNKTAAIGDYFNDYEMLRTVGFPACCGQAPQGIKDIAKLVTCHCNKGAVADLIEYLIAHHGEID